MSEERVEIVRAMIDAFQRGDAETALSRYSEAVVFEPLVAGVWRHGGRGRTSGIETEDGGATVFTIVDGLISHARVCADRTVALEAAGLPG
jgi:hypothetical protein